MSESHTNDQTKSSSFDMLEPVLRPATKNLSLAMDSVFDDIEHGTPPVEWRVADEPWGTFAFVPFSILVVGGPTSGGKTALLLYAIVQAMLRYPSLRVLIANNESQTCDLIKRMIAFLAGINLRHVRQRDRTHCIPERLAAAREQMRGLQERLRFVERPFTVDQVIVEAKEFGANIVCLDTLQKGRLAEYDGDAQERVERIMGRLRDLADLGPCVVTAAALSRSGVSHMHGRGGQTRGNDLDTGIFLHSSAIESNANDAYALLPDSRAKTAVNHQGEYEPIPMWLNHVKARDDMKTNVPLLFDGRYQKFSLRNLATEGSRRASNRGGTSWDGGKHQGSTKKASGSGGKQGSTTTSEKKDGEQNDHRWLN